MRPPQAGRTKDVRETASVIEAEPTRGVMLASVSIGFCQEHPMSFRPPAVPTNDVEGVSESRSMSSNGSFGFSRKNRWKVGGDRGNS